MNKARAGIMGIKKMCMLYIQQVLNVSSDFVMYQLMFGCIGILKRC